MSPPRIFIDSSVLFSAIYSYSGHSNDLLIMGALGEILAVISDFFVIETRRNIHELKPAKIPRLEQVLTSGHFEVVSVTPKEVAEAKRWIVLTVQNLADRSFTVYQNFCSVFFDIPHIVQVN